MFITCVVNFTLGWLVKRFEKYAKYFMLSIVLLFFFLFVLLTSINNGEVLKTASEVFVFDSGFLFAFISYWLGYISCCIIPYPVGVAEPTKLGKQ